MQRTEFEMLTLKRRSTAAPERAKRLDCLVGPRTAMVKVDSERLEFLLHPSASNSEHDSPTRKYIHCRDFLCSVNRMPLRQDQYAGRELDCFRNCSNVGERYERVRDRYVVSSRHLSIFASRVRQMFDRDCDVLHTPQRFKTASLGRGRPNPP